MPTSPILPVRPVQAPTQVARPAEPIRTSTALPRPAVKPKTAKFSGILGQLKKYWWIGLILLIVIVIGVAIFFALSYMSAASKTNGGGNNQSQQQTHSALDDIDSKAILAEIRKYLTIPNEEPAIALVEDAQQVKGQDFFKNAQNGDVVFIFSAAGRGLIYRPSTHQVIEYSKVDVSSPPKTTK